MPQPPPGGPCERSGSSVADVWREALRSAGYEDRATEAGDLARWRKLPRVWRRILHSIEARGPLDFFEAGSGGGKNLVHLALHNHRCTGIDCSDDVLDRCRLLMADVEALTGEPLGITTIAGDFLNFESGNRFDVVFNFGVVEHFLDDEERNLFVSKMCALCRPGGWVVSVVPNGIHPLRQRMRSEGIGGYVVPEIDYSPALLTEELRRHGCDEVKVFPHNLLSYRTIEPPAGRLRALLAHAGYLSAQALPPFRVMPLYRRAGTLVAVGRMGPPQPISTQSIPPLS